MLDSLALLVIVFVVMSVVSLIGVALLFLVKNEKLQTGIFYFLAVWGMLIAWCNVQSIPLYMTGELLLAWGLGGLGAAAMLVKICGKKENSFQVAKVLATVSVVAGMIDCFMF